MAISAAVLRTKLQMPRIRPTLVLRPRLLDKLNRGWDGKATFISAPAGFGKTTLISAWLAQLDSQTAWLSLDANDNDLRQFLAYLVLALETVDTQLSEGAKALLETVPRSFAPDNVLIPLLNNVAASPGRITLVLDDYHEIKNDAIHHAVTYLFDHSPPNLHLVFTSREEIPLRVARWRVRGQLTELNAQDLRFSVDEAADFMTHVMGLHLTADTVTAITEQTEGWAAGLQIVALSLQAKPETAGVNFSANHRYFIDYMAEEVMANQSPEMRDFLCRTAVCDRFSADLCATLTGRADSRAILDQLESANLFLVALDDERTWYRYHRLFAEFLRAQLSDDERDKLHLTASHWFEQTGSVAEAIRHATAAHALDRATDLVHKNGESLVKNGRFTLLLDWVNAMPDEIVRNNSVLSARKAYFMYLRGQIDEAERYRTYSYAAPPPTDPAHQAELLTFRASHAYTLNQFEKAETLALRSMALSADSADIFNTYALNILGQSQLAQNQLEAALKTFEQALRLGRQRKHDYMSILSLSFLAPLLYQMGDRPEAIRLCEEALSQYVDQWGNYLPMAGLLHVSLGVLQYAGNALEQAQHHLDIGLELCERLGVIFLQLVGMRTLARLRFAQNDTEGLHATIRAARQIANRLPNPIQRQQIDIVLANLHLRQGKSDTAEKLLTNVHPSRQARLAQARLYLAQGETDAAIQTLARLAEKDEAQGHVSRLITIKLLQAMADADAADQHLPTAIKLAAAGNYSRLFIDEGIDAMTLVQGYRSLAPAFIDSITAVLPAQKIAPAETTLTGRESEILALVAQGMTNQQIADKLFITVSTTKWYLNIVYRKLEVKNRTKAVAKARSLGLLAP